MKGILAGTVDRDVSLDYMAYRSIVELILAAIRLPAECYPTLHIGCKVVAKGNKRGCRLIKSTEHGINIGINPGINYTDDGSHRFCYVELPGVNSEKVFMQLIEKWGDQNFDPRPKAKRTPEKSLSVLTDKPRGEPFDTRFEGGKKETAVEALPPRMAEGMRQVFNIYPPPVGSTARPRTDRPGSFDSGAANLFSPLGSCFLSREQLALQAKQALKGRPKTQAQPECPVSDGEPQGPQTEAQAPSAESAPPEDVVVQTPPPPPLPPSPVLTVPKPPAEKKDSQMPKTTNPGYKREMNRYTVASQNTQLFSKILSLAIHPISSYDLRRKVDGMMPWDGEEKEKKHISAFTRFLKFKLLGEGHLEKSPDKQKTYFVSKKGVEFIDKNSDPSLSATASTSAPPAPQPPATTQVSDGADWKAKYDELLAQYGIICAAVKRLINNEEEIGTRKKVRIGLLAALGDLIPRK